MRIRLRRKKRRDGVSSLSQIRSIRLPAYPLGLAMTALGLYLAGVGIVDCGLFTEAGIQGQALRFLVLMFLAALLIGAGFVLMVAGSPGIDPDDHSHDALPETPFQLPPNHTAETPESTPQPLA